MEKNRKNPRQGGFTLLEVMIVLFILVMLASMAIYAVQGTRLNSMRQGAYIYIGLLSDAVERYEMNVGYPPTTEQGLAALVSCPSNLENPGAWAGPYIKSGATSRDPWGNDYQYISPGRNDRPFEIWSFGQDRQNGTDADIGSWHTPQELGIAGN